MVVEAVRSDAVCVLVGGCNQKPEFTDKKVTAGKEYEYRVTAENAGGESDPSDVSQPIKAKPLKGLVALFSLRRCRFLHVR